MDPLTHAAVPLALGGPRRARWRLPLLAALGGLLPDIEKGAQLIAGALPGDAYLYFKHGGTHTVWGAALLCLSAALLLESDRLRAFLYLLLGAYTHILLDIVHLPWSVRPFLPLSAWVIPSERSWWAGVAQALLLAGALLWIWLRTRRAPAPLSGPGRRP